MERRPCRICRWTCRLWTATSTLSPVTRCTGRPGIGVLYGKSALLDAMPPYQGGGDMISSVTFEKTTYNKLPYKFEAGTPTWPGAIGLGAAIEYCERPRAGQHRCARARAAGVRHRDGCSDPRHAPDRHRREKAGVLSFVLDSIHPHDIGTILDQEGIAIRTGHHCAQPVMQRFGIAATARASLAVYNTKKRWTLWSTASEGAGGVRLMADLRDLYQEVILEHSKAPRNYRELATPTTRRKAITRCAATTSPCSLTRKTA